MFSPLLKKTRNKKSAHGRAYYDPRSARGSYEAIEARPIFLVSVSYPSRSLARAYGACLVYCVVWSRRSAPAPHHTIYFLRGEAARAPSERAKLLIIRHALTIGYF